MVKDNILSAGIPVSPDLSSSLSSTAKDVTRSRNKSRLMWLSFLTVSLAAVISVIAKGLIFCINFFTNLFFYGSFSLHSVSPANNHLGAWVILIPAIGGLVVGLMAFFGSKAIRGHGIPEAMEQILTNDSKIHPSISYLKPLSSAISIGSGGPFGAEGPIISTGGALGSTLGQLLNITANERKILLTAGATAGMSAIFGTPIAAVFLAIELLLFEFSPRSIIPVALACITGAVGHHIFFESGPVFPMPSIESPSNTAVAMYSVIGLLIGVISSFVTKAVYHIEDWFEKLPIHWMWWPALGGLAVGLVGYFAPRTLGVGYENITDLLSGSMPFKVVVFLCVLKFVSWAVALGSGTSGGTLAPLLTIGGATGCLIGMAVLYFFPNAGIVLPVAALVGMSAMFAGASRALLTSIIFALEVTDQAYAILPVLGGCVASYVVSYLLLENTIMTEKIARRGIRTPNSYEPDLLEKVSVEDVLSDDNLAIGGENTIEEVRTWFNTHDAGNDNHFVIVDSNGTYKGIANFMELYQNANDADGLVIDLIKGTHVSITSEQSLRTAVEIMAKENIDALPVVSRDDNNVVIGVLSHKDIISAYKNKISAHRHASQHISIKRRTMTVLVHGQKLMTKLGVK